MWVLTTFASASEEMSLKYVWLQFPSLFANLSPLAWFSGRFILDGQVVPFYPKVAFSRGGFLVRPLRERAYTRQLKFDPGTPTNIDPPRELIPFQEAKNTCFFLLNFWRISFFSTLGRPCQGESEATLIRPPKCARLNSAMSSRMPSGSSQIGEMGQF